MEKETNQRYTKRLFKCLATILFQFCLFVMMGWATVAIYYSNLPLLIRPWAAGLFAIGSLSRLIYQYRARWALYSILAAFVLVLSWWLLIPSSNNRDWQPDITTLAWADITKDKVTIHNIRNCAYQTETEFTVRYYDKTFDLSQLKSIDFFLVYWGSPKIAHTMMSFNFGKQGNVCFSIETRKEKGEEYSTIKGFFRQYEIIYVVADERDVVRLRTNYREKGKGEDVYLYQLNISPEIVRRVFLSYLDQINRLKNNPQWYNALTDNCTTSIRQHTIPYNPDARIDWRLLVNGYIDEMLYERNILDRRIPFGELKKQSYINPKAQAADKATGFSQLIRVGLPAKEMQ